VVDTDTSLLVNSYSGTLQLVVRFTAENYCENNAYDTTSGAVSYL